MTVGDHLIAATADHEAAFVHRLKERSASAWAELYDSCYLKLFRYAYVRLRDAALAEDITASVFLEAYEHIDSFTYRGRPLLAWLYRIATHLVGKNLRSRRREQRALEASAARLEQSAPGPETSVERHDLLEALGKLTKDQQQVIILRHFTGLTFAQVAAVMNRRKEAVYALHIRALASLRRLMTGKTKEAKKT